ncbi:MAG: rod shape-determining protein RodA [Sphingomonadales bacterium]
MGTSLMFGPRRVEMTITQKLMALNWVFVLAVCAVAGIGFAMLYSVAGGSLDPWASKQMVRFSIGLVLMLTIALIDLRYWMAMAFPIYFLCLAALVAVELVGASGMGGQRWIDLGFIRMQPSEFMKVAMILVLARYFHGLNLPDTRKVRKLLLPVILIGLPSILIVRQPDLGTTMMLILAGTGMLFLSGARAWIFVTGGIGVVVSIPIFWRLLRDYQQERLLVFFNPESDPLGAGYQIMQSKIALGSGGVSGKGFLAGTQSHLNFLPEMKTDFIFTVLAEEFGITGGIVLLGLYLILLIYGMYVSFTCRSQFGRLLAMGLVGTLFLYVFINIGMVMGLLPVVGVPLPLVSYGGSAMLTALVLCGLILSVSLHRGQSIPRKNAFG